MNGASTGPRRLPSAAEDSGTSRVAVQDITTTTTEAGEEGLLADDARQTELPATDVANFTLHTGSSAFNTRLKHGSEGAAADGDGAIVTRRQQQQLQQMDQRMVQSEYCSRRSAGMLAN